MVGDRRDRGSLLGTLRGLSELEQFIGDGPPEFLASDSCVRRDYSPL